MSTYIRWLHKLWRAPGTLRFVISMGVMLLCTLLYCSLFPTLTNRSLFIILAFIVSTWFFGARGFIITALCQFGTIFLFYSWWFHTLLYPAHIYLLIIQDFALGLVLSLVVYALREAMARTQGYQARLQENTRLYEQQQQKLLRHISHELRTPLTAVYGYLHLLQDNYQQLEPRQHLLLLDDAISACQQVFTLMNTLLDPTRSQTNQPAPQSEPFQLKEHVQTVLNQVDPRPVRLRDVRVDIPEKIFVQADEQFLLQIMRNLLSNALKYTSEGARITISAIPLPAAEDETGSIRVSVEDNGPGIAVEEQGLLFQPFTRLAHARHGDTPGTGLGLYISKGLVEAMGGHIWVESSGRPGDGTTFHFTVPAAPSIGT